MVLQRVNGSTELRGGRGRGMGGPRASSCRQLASRYDLFYLGMSEAWLENHLKGEKERALSLPSSSSTLASVFARRLY